MRAIAVAAIAGVVLALGASVGLVSAAKQPPQQSGKTLYNYGGR